METGTILAIAIPVLVALAAVVLFTASRRRDAYGAIGELSRETRSRDRQGASNPLRQEGADATISGREYERRVELERASAGRVLVPAGRGGGAPVPYVPPDPETLGVTRRQFFNRTIVGMFVLGLSGFGTAVIAFLWPTLSGGFGDKIRVGSKDDILGSIRDTGEPFYFPEGRLYVNPYPEDAVSKASAVYDGAVLSGMEEGLVALYQKCPHLGCRVPWCATSQWFECGCHGSQYNRVGEKKGGPAPRGMDRFGVAVEGGTVVVDTGLVVQGPPIGVNTTGQEAEGPHCVSGGSH